MKLHIEKAVYGGAGLARVAEGEATMGAAGKTIFVAGTIPGEWVEAHITDDRKGFANAELDSILEPATTRTAPVCPYYGTCGGCHYQHATYPQQLDMKAAILQETLERGGIVGKALPTIGTLSGEPWEYRNRIRLHMRAASATHPARLCYRERGRHAMLAVNECPIAAPVLVRALQAIQRLYDSSAGSSFCELCEEIEFFTNSRQDAVLLTLSTSQSGTSKAAGEHLDRLCIALQRKVPEICGAAIFATEDSDRSVGKGSPSQSKFAGYARTTLATWGAGALSYSAAGHEYRVSTGSFFQVNRFLIDDLIELVTHEQAGKVAWDLYAGVGLFARALASKFGLVRAVESAPSSCGDLRHNLEGTKHKIVESSTVDFLRLQGAALKSSAHPDLVVVDPPRAGLGSEVTTLLARVAAREIVYVSCDPATLARDLRALLQSGYQLQHITLVDLFPQTFHLESVSRLSLR